MSLVFITTEYKTIATHRYLTNTPLQKMCVVIMAQSLTVSEKRSIRVDVRVAPE
jgi:hypothetical protein